MIAASSASCGRFWTNERSIFSSSIGKRLRDASDEYPVPKSSMDMRVRLLLPNPSHDLPGGLRCQARLLKDVQAVKG